MKIWNIPYAVEIGLSLNALNALIAGVVKIANDNFYKEQVQTNINYDTQEELIEEGVVENED